MYTWVRNPTWITAAFGQQFAGKDGRNFDCTCLTPLAAYLAASSHGVWLTGVLDTDEQKVAFDQDRESYHRYKKMIENELNKRFKLVLRNTKESDEANAVGEILIAPFHYL